MSKTGIPVDFEVSGDMKDWVSKAVPNLNWKLETERFIDYWLANGKLMHDWMAAWRNWMRRAPQMGGLMYTQEELRIERLMAEFTAMGFRRAFTRENSNDYEFAYKHWTATKDGTPKRDLSVVRELIRAKTA